MRMYDWFLPTLCLFREMVVSARARYETLPEMVTRKVDGRRSARYRTNRLMADIYASTLQKNVLRGKVSLLHHKDIVAP